MFATADSSVPTKVVSIDHALFFPTFFPFVIDSYYGVCSESV